MRFHFPRFELSQANRALGLARLVTGVCLLGIVELPASEFYFRPAAGATGTPGYRDGAGAEARFANPGALTANREGGFYIADSLNHCVRKVSADGQVTTFAGMVVDSDFDGINEGGSGDGPSSTARFNYPAGVALDAAGSVYVSDAWNHTIRRITPSGWVSTYAGQTGNYGHRDGPVTEALFDDPCGIAVDCAGAIYVAERGSHVIRKISRNGFVTTFAGLPGERGAADGRGREARFDRPSGLCLDSAGRLWVADAGNHTIRVITPDGQVKTVAGIPGTFGHRDGDATNALLFEPMGIALDPKGFVYIADTFNNAIRRLDLDGQLATLRPPGFLPASGDGGGASPEATSQFMGPSGLVVRDDGAIVVADAGNNVIQLGLDVAPVELRLSVQASLPVLHISGGAGRVCTIEARTDSGPNSPWVPLFKLDLTGQPASVVDHTAVGLPSRLYRVRP